LKAGLRLRTASARRQASLRVRSACWRRPRACASRRSTAAVSGMLYAAVTASRKGDASASCPSWPLSDVAAVVITLIPGWVFTSRLKDDVHLLCIEFCVGAAWPGSAAFHHLRARIQPHRIGQIARPVDVPQGKVGVLADLQAA